MLPIDESKSVIHFQHAVFDPGQASYYLQRDDARTGNSFYALRLAGMHGFATLVALKTGPSYAVENHATESYITPLLVKTVPDWGERGHMVANLGEVSYRMFRLAKLPDDISDPGASASCVGFVEMIGHPYGDVAYGKDGFRLFLPGWGLIRCHPQRLRS